MSSSQIDAQHRVTSSAASQAAPTVRPLHIASGTLEAIKWLALVLMTLDHVNKYLLSGGLPALYALGRLAMPLFVFVLAYHLAQPGARQGGVHRRAATRLALYGSLASIPHMALGAVLGGWWPLNIMFTLLAAVTLIGLLDHGGKPQLFLAVMAFSVGGLLVEYWWPALILAVAAWHYYRTPTHRHLAILTLATAALWLVNGNLWACAALPIMLLAPQVNLPVARWRHAFYLYYPAHLAVAWVIR